MSKKLKGFTLMEMLIVLIIVGVLSTLALVQYGAYKENALDRDAKASLKLIRSAERIYRMESSVYYPSSGSISAIASINTNLKLDLSNTTTRSWNYAVWSTGCARATRNGGNGRSFWIAVNEADGEPNAGAGCP